MLRALSGLLGWAAPFMLVLAGAAACAAPRLAPPQAAQASAALATDAVPAASPTPTLAFPQNQALDESQGVKIKAKRLTHNQGTGETLFKGQVEARHAQATLYADELRSRDQGASASVSGHVRVVDAQRQVALEAGQGEYRDKLGEATLSGGVKLVSIDPYALPLTLTGQSAQLSRISRTARIEGGVRVTRAGISATAGAARLDELASSIDLLDGVEAHAGANHVSSHQARFERKLRLATFMGGVKARFVPSQLRAFAADPVKVSGAAGAP